jgi:hypothetical protein
LVQRLAIQGTLTMSLLVWPIAAGCQSQPGHVTLIAADIADTATIIVRRAHQVPQDILLVGQHATAKDLLLAMGTLGALRSIDGDAITVDLRQAPRGRLKTTASVQHEVNKMELTLRDLRIASRKAIPGFGSVVAIDIALGARPGIRP